MITIAASAHTMATCSLTAVPGYALATKYRERLFDVQANPVVFQSMPRNSCSVRLTLRTESQTTIGTPRKMPTGTYSCMEREATTAPASAVTRSTTPGTIAFQMLAIGGS